MDPIRNPDAYDAITINGVPFSGVVKIEGAGDPRKWDKVQGQGQTGAAMKFVGDDLSDFTIRFFLWEPKHFDDYDANIKPLLVKPKPKAKPKPLEIDTPILAACDIRRCVVVNPLQLEVTDETGLYCYPVQMSKYKAPKPIQVLKAGGDGKGPDKPNRTPDADDLVIIELTKQLKDEANK